MIALGMPNASKCSDSFCLIPNYGSPASPQRNKANHQKHNKLSHQEQILRRHGGGKTAQHVGKELG